MKTRQCQPCTACCDGWVQIKLKGCEDYPGKPCPHITGSGCDDYENRPVNPCQTFECAWVKPGSQLPNNFRPDKSGALVIDRALFWQGIPEDLAVPVGREIPSKILDWLMKNAEKNMRPLIYQQQDPIKRHSKKSTHPSLWSASISRMGIATTKVRSNTLVNTYFY